MFRFLLTCSIIVSSFYLTLANNHPSHSTLTIQPNEKSFVLDLEAFEGEAKFVTIADNRGQVIFSDDIESNRKRIKYVLEDLPTDVYTVKVKSEDLVEYYLIKITEETVQLENVETYSCPTIISNGNKIIVEANNDSQDNIRFSIYNKNEEVVYSYSENYVGDFQKVFDLNKVGAGRYRVLLTNDQFTKEIYVTR